MEEEKDKFTLCDGRDIAVYEILDDEHPLSFWSRVTQNPFSIFYYPFWSRLKGIAHNIFSYRQGCFGRVKWCPSGTYFALTKYEHVIICKAGGDLIPMTVCYHPGRVFHVDFSPSGKYLATYYMSEEEVNIRIHDVHNGKLLREFKGSDCGFLGGRDLKSFINDSLPLIRWSVGDKYVSLVEKTSLSIYACEALSSPPLTNISNVVDFCWSPADPFLALLQSDGSDGDILVSIIRFPKEEGVVDTKKLKNVSNLRICWQQEGKYAAFTYKTPGEDSRILIFKLEAHTCTTFVKRSSDILSFSFEPRGDRFAVIYGRKEDLWLKIVELKLINNSQVFKVQANAINWSPAGGLLVLSGYDNWFLYDANERRVLRLIYRHKTEAVQWSPSGRCVAAYAIDKKAVVIRHSSGEILDVIPIQENFYQLLWCPRFCSLVEQKPRSGYDYDRGREARLVRASHSSPSLVS